MSFGTEKNFSKKIDWQSPLLLEFPIVETQGGVCGDAEACGLWEES